MVRATIGFSAGPGGRGAAYIALSGPEHLLRVPFEVVRRPALGGREVGYAAVTAAVKALLVRNCAPVALTIDDPELVADLTEHREVPKPLVMEYVRLRCALNQFARCAIAGTGGAELSARASKEVGTPAAA
jgi:hypothetical protein